MTREELDAAWAELDKRRAKLDRDWDAHERFLKGLMWACLAFLVLYPVACAVAMVAAP